MMRRVGGLILAAATLLSCTGGVKPSPLKASGGTPDEACTQSDPKQACAADGSGVVRCQGGIWWLEEDCGQAPCRETEDDSGAVVSAACFRPTVANASLAKACSLMVHCGVGGAPSDVGNCADPAWFTQARAFATASGNPGTAVLVAAAARAQTGCINAATSCDDVAACVSAPSKAPCGNDGSRCEGDVLVSCGIKGPPLATDCTSLGMGCIDVPMLGEAACVKQVSCAGPEGARCVGQKVELCIGGAGGYTGIRLDCGPLGLECMSDPGTQLGVVCAKASSACDPKTFKERCDGENVVLCAEGETGSIPCKYFGRTCRAVDGTADCVTPGGCTATMGCKGDVLHTCTPQGVATLDCAAIGLVCDPLRSTCGFAAVSP